MGLIGIAPLCPSPYSSVNSVFELAFIASNLDSK